MISSEESSERGGFSEHFSSTRIKLDLDKNWKESILGGLGGIPQQAVAATDYSTKGEMYIPPLLAPQKTKMGVGEKLGKTTSEENKQSYLLSPNNPPNFPHLYFEQ